ncbi:MAG: DNA polymerase III subunit beta [Deltaproteobacteria bacterium HGW-Deltaproteobacteria-14]|jgi:DNA polymerase-3 subunit beta|nr:MAG: DNA polymerase III subunit beta [Deltaproteobacteria bacterium HGW-Deltaproteobacteria-14]
MATLELKLDRNTFLGAVYKTQGVVDRKSTSNVLSHILVETLNEGRIRLLGTDYDVTIQAEVPAEVIVAGAACINGKSLFDVIKNVDDDEVVILGLPNDWVEVTAGRSVFKLAGITPADFPELQLPEDARWLGIPKAAFKDLVEKTAFSMSDDETRMNLNGVFLKIEPGSSDGLSRLTMVSTDGHRLSKVEIEAELQGYAGESLNAIVHKKGVQEVRRLLDGDGDVLDVGFAPGVILFRSGGTTFSVRQIEDAYPDFAKVIPAAAPVRVVVPRERLLRAIRRNAILTSNKTYIIKVELQPGKIAVTTSNPDYGEGRDEVDVDYNGEGMVIGFNYNYLQDVLNVIRGETAVLELTDEFSPTVVTSPSEPGAIFVVMPMRV